MKKLVFVLLLIFSTVSYADTETVTWYKDGSVYDATTCQTGDYISFPTQPTKRGHNFVGWQVALYDFSTLNASVSGTNYTGNVSSMTWSTTFPYGVVSGKALCSITSGTYPLAGTPDESTNTGQYCWCKATTYKPTGSNIAHANTSSSKWAFIRDSGSASGCTSSCAASCGYEVRNFDGFRRVIFGVTQ